MSWPTSQARGKLLLLLLSVTLDGFQISGSQRNTSIDWDGGKKLHLIWAGGRLSYHLLRELPVGLTDF